MKSPTPQQLRTTIEVLKQLGERINTEAADSLCQLSECRPDDGQAASIKAHAIEQNTQLAMLVTRLDQWLEEMQPQTSFSC
jgi:hypothetical protein